MKLSRDFYMRNTLEVSKELIGKILVHKTKEGVTRGRIIEVEAYIGPDDKGSHAYGNRRTARTEIQYGPGGYAYIYLIYGMYYCMNIVTGKVNCPEVVLIRALEPLDGVDLMKKRRKTEQMKNLCSGPGKLCSAMGIDKMCYGLDLCGETLYLEEDNFKISRDQIAETKRINIDYAEEAADFLWRYILSGSKYLSVKQK